MHKIVKERFIPYRRTDVIDICKSDKNFSNEEVKEFSQFCEILTNLFHFELHKKLEHLKDCYAPFDPDRDTKVLNEEDDLDDNKQQLEIELKAVLEQANFECVSESDLNDAMQSESLFRVKLQVDFDDFEEVLFFRRGVSFKTETINTIMGLRKVNIELEVYDRIVVYVRFKNQQHFDSLDKTELYFEPGSTIIKLFRNVPKNDMEMLFPNTEVRMKPIDKLLIGVPTAVGGIFMLVTKLGATLLLVFSVLAFWLGLHDKPATLDQPTLIALLVGLGGLGGFLWRQFSKYKTRKIQFMKQLAENLYFKNLDNNAGVFHHLIDAAEEEECKETILAYYHLLNSDIPLSANELDAIIEQWFNDNYNCVLDFEMHDALQKLLRLQLVDVIDGKYKAKSLVDSNKQLDSLWDGYFNY
ncbi:MAG: TMEM143 family protein [Gammaproteobacteria bacterium]|nr:TMEM143 family protein [Gammaproteobacteria bacterium]